MMVHRMQSYIVYDLIFENVDADDVVARAKETFS
jgi:hypothetical protein